MVRLALADNGARNGAGQPLLAEVIEDIGEALLAFAVDEIGRARAVHCHPHVERAIRTEGKAALGAI